MADFAPLKWDQTGEKIYETGVEKCALYVWDKTLNENKGGYGNGVAWNGVQTITESPSGAEESPIYADDIKYASLRSAEEFGATIECYTYPDAWSSCDGSVVLAQAPGLHLPQQARVAFGLAYETLKGNDSEGTEFGKILHLIYNATANPAEKAYASVNDSPEAISFSYELTTTPIEVGEIGGIKIKPLSHLTVDSTLLKDSQFAAIEKIVYGSTEAAAKLPMPAEIFSAITTSVTGA